MIVVRAVLAALACLYVAQYLTPDPAHQDQTFALAIWMYVPWTIGTYALDMVTVRG